MKKAWSLLVLAAIASSVFANVDLRTNIQDIYYRGTCEEAGVITMSVNGNDFHMASTQEPVFIRIRVNKGATLCNTLVSHIGDVNNNTMPIYLAMRVESGLTQTGMAAHEESVSIVRWKKGENALWIRVQTSSETWLNQLNDPATMYPPNVRETVAWTIGQTARASFQANAAKLAQGKANLPYNTWDVDNSLNVGGTGWAISTLLCVNVSQSILTPYPADGSILDFDTISFLGDVDDDGDDTGLQTIGVRTCTSADCIVTGDQADVNFSGDDSIARGEDVECTWKLTGKHDTASAWLCVEESTQLGFNPEVCMTTDVTAVITCDYGLNYGTEITFTPADDDIYGIALVSGTTNVTGSSWVMSRSDSFKLGSKTYYNDATLTYVGTDHPELGSFTVLISMTVCTRYDIDPVHVAYDVQAWVSNHANELDLGPDGLFDGTHDNIIANTVSAVDQRKHCPASLVELDEITWDFGDFTDCITVPAVIFFPYVPKLQGTDWWFGFGVVNQGMIDFGVGDVQARLYEADGTLYTFELPALAQRCNYTFLIQDGAEGPAIYGDDDLVIQGETATDDLVMGDQRSSMFVVAQTVAEWLGQVFNADIDGFGLVGNSVTGESFGTLPRNYDNNIPGQNADLPLRRAK